MTNINKWYTEAHSKNLPTIRISNIVLNHFKSVKHGEIDLNCGRKFIPYGTQSDILGLYGQNGSGKTSVIEAISILKHLLSGEKIPDIYVDCIDKSTGCSELEFTFDVQYPEDGDCETKGDVRKVVYSFKLKVTKKEKNTNLTDIEKAASAAFGVFSPKFDTQLCVFDELLKVGGEICGKKCILQPFFDTRESQLAPSTKIKELLGDLNEKTKDDIRFNRRWAEEKVQSFIFMKEMIELYYNNNKYSPYFQMILELQLFAKEYLTVFDSKTTGLINLNFVLPIMSSDGMIPINLSQSTVIPERVLKTVQNIIESISRVLTQIVPGLEIKLKKGNETLDEEGNKSFYTEAIAIRNGVELPLRCESDGVRKLIATLNCIICAYNFKSYTVAYDEFDSGVFEYLLGEILQILQSSGKGQFIFTSHNMRPLEVLNKDFVYFTTTDENNRYIRLKRIGGTNNLRRVYYREIAMHENYDNLYSDTKRAKIISALRKSQSEVI